VNNLRRAVARIKRARKMKRFVQTSKWINDYRLIPGGYNRRAVGGKEIDAVNKDVIEVLPTYYEYDEDGKPTGAVNGAGPRNMVSNG
jgi:hypothetical protein